MKTLFNIKTKLKKSIFMIIIGLSINMNYGQVGINTTSPQGMLEVNSNNQGVVLPKVQLTDINTALPVVNPNGVNLSIGTIVYNTNTAGISPNNVVPGYYFWDGAKWVMFSAGQEKNIYTDDGEINELRTVMLTNKVNFDDNTFVIDGINNNVGVGTLNPSGKLHVNSDDGKDAIFSMSSNNPSEDMDLDIYRLRGTSTSPNIIQNGDGLGGIRFNGLNMNTTGVLAPFSIMAEIKAEADGTITPTSAPAALNFKTATAGSAAATTKMTIKNNGKVGIGTTTPNPRAVLQINALNNDAGILIPRLTTVQRNAMVMTNTEDGVMIFNTDEDCFNYWHKNSLSWKSICGDKSRAVFTISCATSNQAFGNYVVNQPVSNENFINLTINVTTPGNYTIYGTTTNGYNFSASGEFISAGNYSIQLLAQGTPLVAQIDTVTFTDGNLPLSCANPTQITVLSKSDFTFDCTTIAVNGQYKVGQPLVNSNTLTIPVNVTSLGYYTINSNNVDGISFNKSGTFTALGVQNITIIGSGIPNSSSDKTLTLTISSASGSTTCSVTISIIIAAKKILHLGDSSVWGYSAYLKASRNMLNAPNNFGPYSSSLVKYEGFSNNAYHLYATNTTPSELASLLNERPDIVIIGYAYAIDTDEAVLLRDYVNSNGILIAFIQDATSSQNLARQIFNDNTITASVANAAGALYRLPSINDLILNGPFGDTRNGWWGEDASATCYLTGSSINSNATIYNTTVTQSSSTNLGITFFKHNSKNFIWNGDAGFISNSLENGTYVSSTICPFATNSTSNFPVTKTFGFPAQQVSNSILFANMMAWAIKQAETNGINN